ncbi:MAG: hypothetical protein ABI823_09280 [Bryobacteraceae bacterium]
MHIRRLVAFLLGAWMLGTGFMAYVAVHNLRSVDTLLNAPPVKASPMLGLLGQNDARLLLHHQVSQLNRDYFLRWEQTEILIGVLTIFFLVFATPLRLLPVGIATLATVVVLFLHFFISPEIRYLGESLDFVAITAGEGLRSKMWALHQVYTAATLVKLAVCGVLMAYLLWFRERAVRRRRVVSELDASDSAHVTQAVR